MIYNKVKKNKTKKMKNIKLFKKNNRKTKNNRKFKKMRGGQDDKPQQGSLRLYRDENPQF
jgi:hypothetical protein